MGAGLRQLVFALLPVAGLLSPNVEAGSRDLDYAEQVVQVGGTPERVRVPAGYRLEVLTEDLEGPRMLTFGPQQDLFIGSKSGRVYRLPPPYREVRTLVRLNDYPHSVAFRDGEILIAQSDGLYRAPYRPGQERINESDIKRIAELPAGGGHSSRTLRIGPDGRVYVSLGISGNCSDEYLDESYRFGERRGGIMVLDERGDRPGWQVFASGLRNPVGFDWHPETGALYASNNGPDHLGFEQPPEYFSRVDPGSFHGMPWFQFDGKEIIRDTCIKRRPPRPLADVTVPEATFPARNAPMAVAFVGPGVLDSDLEGDAIVALRGSWGTRPSGGFLGPKSTRRPPGIVAVRFSDDVAQRVDELVSGFQKPDGERWARPVGLAPGPDGALYFTSDGGTDALFRLRKKNSR